MTISTAIDPSNIARVVGIATEFREFRAGGALILPQRVAVVGQGSDAVTYSTDKKSFNTAYAVGEAYGFGSPLHLAALQLLPVNGDGVGTIPVTFFPLDAAGTAVAATGTITPSGVITKAGEYIVRISNQLSASFVIAAGATVADMTAAIAEAINSIPQLPVVAADGGTEVTLTAKWAGVSSNDIVVEVVGPTDTGATFALTAMAGGLVNPDVQPALDQIGDIWETLVVNTLDINDSTALNAYQAYGVGRWGPTEKKPLVVFTGNTTVDLATAIAVPDARKDDFINSQITAPGSNNLPLEVAARAVARIAKLANANPAHDYGSQKLTGLTPGADAEQWTYTDRDDAVKAGSSTSQVKDGVINLADTITFFHPTGDTLPAYRYVVDIIKLMNIIFNIDLEFSSEKWDGAPLIPDDQPTSNRTAKKPKMARAAAATIIDQLGLEAIISDPVTAKQNVIAGINENNPKRLDLCIPVQLSGNTNIVSVDLKFGFFFGQAAIVA